MTPQPTPNQRWQFWIDRGGTFTDIVACLPNGSMRVHKLLSENPDRYVDAPIQGIRELMGVAENQPIPSEKIAAVKMGTTVATNALLERKGDRTLLITTQGFRDGLRIGYQNRPDIFARQIVLPEMLYEQVLEVAERVSADGRVIQKITPAAAKQLLNALQAAYDTGIRACAIAFLHSYRYPAHEQQVAALAQQIGFTQISASHQVSPLIKWVARGDTAVVDAYLSPLLRRYVDRIEQALASQSSAQPQLLFMQSNGGLTSARFFQGKDSILSGPAGGIVGAIKTSLAAGFEKIITFDMGGTSTDVAHFNRQDGSQKESQKESLEAYERAFETEVAGVRLRAPMMAIHTVAAGGGSILRFESDRYQVGPESAGAYPGPTCYRNGGPLTVTDCNVIVGKLQPQFFPQVFGPKGDQPLDRDLAVAEFDSLAEKILAATGSHRLPEQIAEGFLEIAIDNMANAIKKISVQRGYDVSEYILCCFGAAGGQHACRLAEALGMKTIFIHPYAGVLSAYGMGLAERRVLRETSVEVDLTAAAMAAITQQLGALVDDATNAMKAQSDVSGFSQPISEQHNPDRNAPFRVLRQCHLRYKGTDSTLAVDFADLADMQQQFDQRYQQQYGITLPDKALVIATLTAEVVEAKSPETPTFSKDIVSPVEMATVPLFSANQWHSAPVFQRQQLPMGHRLAGPAMVIETTGTNIIEPGWEAMVSDRGDLILTQRSSKSQIAVTQPSSKSAPPDPVRLEIFNNLFQAIAEQMGFTLQNTSSSVNIKERLDFSCAIFDSQGQLVANAPHIPIHLGSMGASVQALIAHQRTARRSFHNRDVFISNNPYSGGTHLPDITAITPVFANDSASDSTENSTEDSRPLFFVASRGHHADIGGITPGSMPPHSTRLDQEGILLDNFLLVDRGKLRTKELRDRLTTSPYPARSPDQNLADLQAQVAANNKGVQALQNMVKQFGLETVRAYMQHVQDNAEQAVRRAIARLCTQHRHIDKCQVPMDCGAEINVSITLNPIDNSAIIDFTGTSIQQFNNFNAPLAVCKAVVLYVFRTLVESSIPLNAGCLKPLEIRVPAGSMLNPIYPAAVVAGNVETSQAVTDALYGALGMLAAAQGTMNNFTFGNSRYQYYETICGGSGAGPSFHGTDAVQTHMTNSRLTDPEVLELRFPVLLKEFSIRAHSGGTGQYQGGNGVIRHLLFREAMSANLLSGRHTTQPFGLAGGNPGQPGHALVHRANGQQEVLSATATVMVQPGDSILIETPGGGGYGISPSRCKVKGCEVKLPPAKPEAYVWEPLKGADA